MDIVSSAAHDSIPGSIRPAWAPTTQAELPTIQKTVDSGAAIHNMGIPDMSFEVREGEESHQ